MKWMTHQTVAVLGAVALHLPLGAVGTAFVGAVLPDVIDQRRARWSRNPQKRFNQIHRGTSHWFGWYALLLAGALAAPWPPLVRDLVAGLALGALSHIVLDMLTPAGVPLAPFSRERKLSMPLCRTGGLGEMVFLAASVGLFWYCGGDALLRTARHLGRALGL